MPVTPDPSTPSPAPPRPLAVDLDGTLVLGDTLHESVLGLLCRHPLDLLRLPLWLAGGKAQFKRQVARRHVPDPQSLAWNQPLLDWLRTQQGRRELVLCTAADEGIAQTVADHLGLFDTVLASNGEHNLAGAAKAEALVERYGEKGFDYIGSGRADLPVWRHAHTALLSHAPDSILRAARAHGPTERLPGEPAGAGVRTWLRALRVHQWAKNLLLFVPLLTAHLVFDARAVAEALLAFLAFSLCASAVYIINDLADLAADRMHPRKRHRPLASGRLTVPAAVSATVLLLATAFTVAALLLPRLFGLALGAYFLLTLAYSLRLKRVAMLDVVVLAALYTARIVAGAFALQVELSFWLLAFSMFLFLSLALLKRHTELAAMDGQGQVQLAGRGYATGDLSLVAMSGIAAGQASVLVLALYIDSPASAALYSHPALLWLLCPLLLFWIGRVWLLSHRRRMHDDPLVFALTDPASLVVLVLALLTVGAAI